MHQSNNQICKLVYHNENQIMERMKVILITVLLLISAVIAEDVVDKADNPIDDAATSETHDPVEYVGTNEIANLAKHVSISLAINQIFNGQSQAYESPRLRRFVTHCSSHVVETCSGNYPMHLGGEINGQLKLSLCLFDSMEACLVDHKVSLYQATSSYKPKESIQYLPVFIQTIKFQTVLRTCSHVSAQSCLTGSNVDASVLSNCLLPSLNWCVYPTVIRNPFLYQSLPLPPPSPPRPPSGPRPPSSPRPCMTSFFT